MGSIDTICAESKMPSTKSPDWLGILRAAAMAILEQFSDRRAKRRSRAALRSLTADQLRDVGLTPDDVRREAAKSSFWR